MLAGESLYSSEEDLLYLTKLDWLWENLSEVQRNRIKTAVSSGTLLQQQSRRCILGNAAGDHNTLSSQRSPIHKMIDMVFYDGPSYAGLFSRKVTPEEKKTLDDIYYGKIRHNEDYTRANRLVYRYVMDKLDANN